VVECLRGRVNYVLHDKRGHGLSGACFGTPNIETYARDVKELLAKVGASNTVLCGLSVGGLISQALMQDPEMALRGVVLSNTGAKIGDETAWNKRIADVRGNGMGMIADGVMERWFSKSYRQGQPEALALYRTMLLRCPVDGYAACCAAIRDADYRHAVVPRCPVLCVGGSDDGSTPPDIVKALAASLTGARYHEFAGAAHLPCIEQPDSYAAVLSAFVQSL
jgi:3-oxoadipate enol-lactonase